MQTSDSVSPPTTEVIFNETVKINWYRCKVDRALMSDLMRKSDAKAFRHVLMQLGLYACNATLSFVAFKHIHADNWPWMLPLFLLALFVHGTCANFYGGDGGHELTHKTPFKTQFWNDFFLTIYAFLSWFDPVGYRLSHSKHHQFTTYQDHDGEVVLPQGFKAGFYLFLRAFTFDPIHLWNILHKWTCAAFGDSTSSSFFGPAWMAKLIPQDNEKLRRNHRNWARVVLLGHLALATLFIATGNWILIFIITFGCQICPWLVILCNWPQHIGLSPNTPDFRLCCRTFTCSPLVGFLYWNMQYHVEHHMFPSVPVYNLPRLRAAIEHDLPPAPHGLWAVWREMWPVILRQRTDSSYSYAPPLPQNGAASAN